MLAVEHTVVNKKDILISDLAGLKSGFEDSQKIRA